VAEVSRGVRRMQEGAAQEFNVSRPLRAAIGGIKESLCPTRGWGEGGMRLRWGREQSAAAEGSGWRSEAWEPYWRCCVAVMMFVHTRGKRGRLLQALEAVRQAVQQPFGRFPEASAVVLLWQPDHGSQFRSTNSKAVIRSFRMECSRAFLLEAEGNCCVERFFRTLKEQLLWVRRFNAAEELTEAQLKFPKRCNSQGSIELLHFPSAQEAHQALLPLDPDA